MRDRTSRTKTLNSTEVWDFLKTVRSISGLFSCDPDGTVRIENAEVEFKK